MAMTQPAAQGGRVSSGKCRKCRRLAQPLATDAARALEPLDAREDSPHGLGLELPGGAVALRLQEQAVERRLEGDADPQVSAMSGSPR